MATDTPSITKSPKTVGTYVGRAGSMKKQAIIYMALLGVGAYAGGAIGAVLAGLLSGVIVKLTAPRGTAPDSPVVGPVGYLSVNGNEVRLVKAERGLFNTRVTDTVLAAVPQSSVASAALQRARLASRLHVEFRDGTTWEVDVPSRRRAVVDQVVSELSGTAA